MMSASSLKRRKTNGKTEASSSEASVSSTDKPEFDVRATEFGLRPRRACTTKSNKKVKEGSDGDENGDHKDNDYGGSDNSDDSDSYENGASKDEQRGSKGFRVVKRASKRPAPASKKRSPSAQKKKAPTKSAPPAAAAGKAQAVAPAAKTMYLTAPRQVGRPSASGQSVSTGNNVGNSRGGNIGNMPNMNPANDLSHENMLADKL